jgi:benzoate membrane transport protein
MGLAVVAGAGPALLLRTSAEPITRELPTLVIPEMTFSFHSFIAVSVPLVVLTLGLGNVQGIGFLMAQGYRVAVDRITVVVAANSLLNALLCGHPAIVARTGVAIVAGPEAGPAAGRYWASIIAAALTAAVATAAGPMMVLFATLPRSYLVALTGLALVSSLQAALEHAFDGRRGFGALVAFAVATTPFAIAGIPSTFWSLLAGGAAAAIVDRGRGRTSNDSLEGKRTNHELHDPTSRGDARMREPAPLEPANVGRGAQPEGAGVRVGGPSQGTG